MPRNEERLGGLPSLTNSNSAEEVITQETVSLPTQTELVDLPSKGRFYPEGSPLKDKQTLEIRFMSAKSEDILTSKSLLRKGTAIDRMLQSLIVENVKVDDLLIGDKNALVVAARISGYGSEYKTKVNCPFCEAKFEKTFDLTQIKTKQVEESLPENTKNLFDEFGHFEITLPKSKLTVKCRLLNGKDEKYLSQLVEGKRKQNLPESLLTDQLKLMIVSVGSETNRAQISKIIDQLPALDARYLRREYQEAVPNIDMQVVIVCPECDNEQEVDMPLGAEFFWPK